MDEAIESRPQRPSQCAPTEYPNAGKREQGIEGSFSLREFPWEHAYRKVILDPRDILSRRGMVTPWRMVAFNPGEAWEGYCCQYVITTLPWPIEISNQQSAPQQSASGISISATVVSSISVRYLSLRLGVAFWTNPSPK